MTDVAKKAALVRKWSLISTSEAGSGHPTSCLSSADLTTVLFDKFFTYDLKNPQNPQNDRLIFSKGHGAPLLYTLFALSSAFPLEELKTLRQLTSRLEGHPTPEFKYTEAATGSLGQGLSIGAGLAYGIRSQIRNSPKVYVLLGDGEMAEGSVWEAANFASYYKLHNLIALVDVNRLGQSQETMFGHKTQEYVKRLNSFGWETKEIDGHNLKEIEKAFNSALQNKSGKPFAIVAKTKKGKGVSLLENNDSWHGKALKKEDLEKAIKELGEVNDSLRFTLRSPRQFADSSNARLHLPMQSIGGQASTPAKLGVRSPSATLVKNAAHAKAPRVNYKLGEEIATREVYGQVLGELGNTNPLIYALDGDVKNSTFSQDFKKIHPDRFIECFIAEQNMVGVAVGLSRLGKKPFISTFAAFLTRAFDQIRMAALSKANITFVGSHAGVSIGEDGPSQMGLEDFAMFGALLDSVILHPSDAVSTTMLLPQLVDHIGISYLRTLRPKTPVLYDVKESFKIGGSKILRTASDDILTVVTCGITVHEALKAYDQLKEKGILIRVVDCYSLKPIDEKTLLHSASETKHNVLLTVEDHYPHGGLGDFVQSAVSQKSIKVIKMAVSKTPHSGTKDELLDYVGISANHIVKKAIKLCT